MGAYEFFTIILIGVCTYLLRFIPLKLSLSGKSGKGGARGRFSEVLEVAGISIIAALLVSSLFGGGQSLNLSYSLNLLISCSIVIIVSVLWKNPGISVLAGVFSFASIGMLI